MVGIVLENTKVMTITSVATISGILIGALWYRKYLKNKPPTKWMKVGEIQDLIIYPIKSARGIKASTLECTPSGPRLDFLRDRSFVMVDKEGKFVTGRDHPKITQVVVSASGTVLTLSSPESSDQMRFDMSDIRGEPNNVLIWGTWTKGIDCGDEVALWLSRYVLGEDSGIRLLFCGNRDTGKNTNDKIQQFSKMAEIQLQNNDGGMFSDAVSYHLISEASVAELNSRLEETKVSALNFRPNFIIKGEMLIPFEEDDWKWVKIGSTVFQCLAPCTRCLFTTVDPNTGVKSEKMEPLASLRRYRHVREPTKRKLFNTPAMGIYIGLRSVGHVSVGDEVFIPQM